MIRKHYIFEIHNFKITYLRRIYTYTYTTQDIGRIIQNTGQKCYFGPSVGTLYTNKRQSRKVLDQWDF